MQSEKRIIGKNMTARNIRLNNFTEIIDFFETNNTDFKQQLEDLYLKEFKTYRQLQVILNVNNRTIKKLLTHYNIPIRYKGEAIKTQWINNDKRRASQGEAFRQRMTGKESIRRVKVSDFKILCSETNHTYIKRFKVDNTFYFEIVCNNCKRQYTVKGMYGLRGKCCIYHDNKRIISNGEIKTCEFLISKNISFKMEYSFKDLYHKGASYLLRFDFAIFNNGTLTHLIEYDGIQHYKKKGFSQNDFRGRRIRDELKNEYAKNNNIPLIRVPYYYLSNIEEFLEYKLLKV